MFTVPCSSTPARTRLSTYSRLRVSITMDSMPCNHSRRPSSNPAGPAPTMPTCVRIVVSDWWLVVGGWCSISSLPASHQPPTTNHKPHSFRILRQFPHPFIMRAIWFIGRPTKRRRNGGSQDDRNRERPADHIYIEEQIVAKEGRQQWSS